jgi:phosphate transport system substrate-binding protein
MKPSSSMGKRWATCAALATVASGLTLAMTQQGVAETSTVGARLAGNNGLASYQAQSDVSGSFAIAGSDTMQPLMAKLLAAFKEWQPGVKTVVQGGGSDTALRGFIEDQATIRRGDAKNIGHHVSGSVALLASSRALSAEERKDFQARYGFEPTEIPVAMDAVAIYVSRDNPIKGLTMEQVDAIFGADRKRGYHQAITKWGELGLEDAWGTQPINLYGRDKRSGTRTFFIHEALLNGKMNSNIKEAPGSASEILEISRDPLGIGYAGTGFQASPVKIVPLAPKAGMAFVEPTAASALDGSYPLARHLYLYAKGNHDHGLEPQVASFLTFINSREGQEIVAKAGYYPLSESQVAKNMQVLNGLVLSARSRDDRG